jgi:hypothetical protein
LETIAANQRYLTSAGFTSTAVDWNDQLWSVLCGQKLGGEFGSAKILDTRVGREVESDLRASAE